jgi:hypothetical protein
MEEEPKQYMSSTEELPQYIRRRNVPDVPDDVDYMMEHLNDPNLDLKKSSVKSSSGSFKGEKIYASSDVDAESSDRYSRNSTAIEFDE